jgi:negative regulator of sigma E activity
MNFEFSSHGKKNQDFPVKSKIKQWLENFTMVGAIECTSLITRIAVRLGALNLGKHFVYRLHAFNGQQKLFGLQTYTQTCSKWLSCFLFHGLCK